MNGVAILLCRNALHLTKRSLATLLNQTQPIDILVIDNASTDGTVKYLIAQQTRYRNIYRMSFPQVQSVARCWNLGLGWAWERGHSRALVVNADTELLPETYARLGAYLGARPAIGMITAVGVAEDPRYPETILERPHPDYSCYMIAKWAHEWIPFDQQYEGAYFEDADHHVRLYRAGIWAGSINLGFLHVSSGTLKHADQDEVDRIHRHYGANKRRFMDRYGCVPGTKAYERLFLPDGSAKNLPAQDGQQNENQQVACATGQGVGLAGDVLAPEAEDQPDNHQDPEKK